MKKIALFLIFCITLGSVSVYAQNSLRLTPSEHDFGEITRGTIVRGEFTITNDGDLTEEFLVRSTCDCLYASTYSGTILPQGNFVLSYEFETDDYKGPTKQGLFIQSLSESGGIHFFTLKGIVITRRGRLFDILNKLKFW